MHYVPQLRSGKLIPAPALDLGYRLNCSIFILSRSPNFLFLSGSALVDGACVPAEYEPESERLKRGDSVVQQQALGRRNLGTRTAHPYRPCVARHLRAGREPLRRARVFGSITMQAPKKARRPCRGRSTETQSPLLLRSGLLKVGDARQYTNGLPGG